MIYRLKTFLLQTDYHPRVSAIALASQKIFQSLEVWGVIKKRRINPFVGIHVWDDGKNAEIKFDSHEINESVLGFIIENNVIQSALEEKLFSFPQIEIQYGVELQHFSHHADYAELVTASGEVIHAKLAVAADGASSWLRNAAQIGIDRQDYEQTAIVATVKTQKSHAKIARQVFLQQGVLAFLPLQEANLSSIVWSLPNELANEKLDLSAAEFQQHLAETFSCTLGDIVSTSPRYRFPLFKQQAKQYVKPNIALIGDAAHVVHPLAGQGINVGLLDAAALAEIIITAIQNRRDFSTLSNLRHYERWRKADNMALLKGIDAIKNLFASQNNSIKVLRTLGLNMTNEISWIKNIFTRHAVGARSHLPQLALGQFKS